jgi:hypothetical protein
LVNFGVLITNLAGDRSRAVAFSQKTPKTAQKTPISYLENGWSDEHHLPLILIGAATFYCDFSKPRIKDVFFCQKTPKTA